MLLQEIDGYTDSGIYGARRLLALHGSKAVVCHTLFNSSAHQHPSMATRICRHDHGFTVIHPSTPYGMQNFVLGCITGASTPDIKSGAFDVVQTYTTCRGELWKGIYRVKYCSTWYIRPSASPGYSSVNSHVLCCTAQLRNVLGAQIWFQSQYSVTEGTRKDNNRLCSCVFVDQEFRDPKQKGGRCECNRTVCCRLWQFT